VVGYFSDYEYSYNYFHPIINASIGWSPSRKFSITANYFAQSDEPDEIQLIDRRVTEGDLIMSNGNPRLKPKLTHGLDLKLSLFSNFNLSFAYYNIKNSIFNTARQISAEESPTGCPFVMLYPDNEHDEVFISRLMYGKTFFNHLDISAGGSISYQHVRYKEIKRSRWCAGFWLDLGYVGLDNTLEARLSYSYNGNADITAMTTALKRTDSMNLYISKRLLKEKNLNIFVRYILPVHFGDNSHTEEMVTDVYRYKMNMDNYFRSDNSIMIGIDYYFHKGEKVKQFNDPMESL
ncbi:MAG: outer membrane beta-barrel family protein, partial [Muribaculaceae bacterium]|nr:outer membrane beta-barrel family protein [Muribaculaceae bacterium]